MKRTRAWLLALGLLGAVPSAWAADDEIQVYTDDINKPGEFGLEMHLNYVTVGSRERAWPQQVPPKQLFRATPEFSYGFTEKVEFGLYLPTTKGPGESVHMEGAKVRIKYLDAPDGRAFYWGVNGELGRLALRTEEQHWNWEIRPIIGYRQSGWNFTVNPRLSGALSGGVSRMPDFSPCFRIMKDVAEDWAVGVEHYAEMGPVNRFDAPSQRAQNSYLVVDGRLADTEFNFGVGKGWTGPSDRVVFKAIIAFKF